MKFEESSQSPEREPEHRIERRRVLFARVDGCRLALALDAIEAVQPMVVNAGREFLDGAGATGSPLEWHQISRAPCPSSPPSPDGVVLVVRTGHGRRGLRVDAVESIREISLAALAPRRTRMVDAQGRMLCLLVELDGGPCFVLDPRALETVEATA